MALYFFVNDNAIPTELNIAIDIVVYSKNNQ